MEAKVKIPYSRKKDFQIIQEQIDKTIRNTMASMTKPSSDLDDENFKLLKKGSQKRLEQLVNNAKALFKKNVEYCKTTDKQTKKVVSENNYQLDKINEVKFQMFKSSVLQIQKNERQEMPVNLSIKPVEDLKVGFCGEDLRKFFERKSVSHPSQKRELERYKKFEKILLRAGEKLKEKEKFFMSNCQN